MSERILKVEGDAREIELILPPPKEEHTKVFRGYWSSPEALSREIRKWDKKEAWSDSGWETGNRAWYGTTSMDGAISLALEGWPEGAEKASRLQNRIRANNPIMLKRKLFSVAGASPDVPRAISGNPLNMRIPDVSKASRRVVITLLSDISAHCGHDGDEFINRAAVVAAVVDEIEASGYACDVITYCNSEGGGWGDGSSSFNYCTSIQVKNSNQPVDISRLAFGLGHTSFFRRMIFAEKGYHQYCKDLGTGLGHSTYFDQKGLAERNIFVIPSINNAKGAFSTEEKAETEGVKYIIEDLKKQGFPLFEVDEFIPQTVPLTKDRTIRKAA